jgi:hypothetical protein
VKDESSSDEEEIVPMIEDDADRKRIMKETMKDSELSALKNQGVIADFWKMRGPSSSSTNKIRQDIPLIDISDDEDADLNDKDATALLKKLGLNLEDDSDDDETLNQAQQPYTSGRSNTSPEEILQDQSGHEQGQPGSWECKACTL